MTPTCDHQCRPARRTLELSGGAGAGADAARTRRRADVRDGGLPAAALLRGDPGRGARAPPRERRALRRVHGRRLMPVSRAAWESATRRSGPGATNLVTALVEAKNAGIPMIALVGDTHRDHSGRGMTQECRPAAAARAGLQGVPAHRGRHAHPRARAAGVLDRDFGPSGPCRARRPRGHLPRAVRSSTPREFHTDPGGGAVPKWRSRPDPDGHRRRRPSCSRAARRPLILAGGGIHLSQAYAELERFASEFGIPVAHTMSGKGAIACIHPLSVGAVRPLLAHRQRADQGSPTA